MEGNTKQNECHQVDLWRWKEKRNLHESKKKKKETAAVCAQPHFLGPNSANLHMTKSVACVYPHRGSTTPSRPKRNDNTQQKKKSQNLHFPCRVGRAIPNYANDPEHVCLFIFLGEPCRAERLSIRVKEEWNKNKTFAKLLNFEMNHLVV